MFSVERGTMARDDARIRAKGAHHIMGYGDGDGGNQLATSFSLAFMFIVQCL